jgi:hypothetical protein
MGQRKSPTTTYADKQPTPWNLNPHVSPCGQCEPQLRAMEQEYAPARPTSDTKAGTTELARVRHCGLLLGEELPAVRDATAPSRRDARA